MSAYRGKQSFSKSPEQKEILEWKKINSDLQEFLGKRSQARLDVKGQTGTYENKRVKHFVAQVLSPTKLPKTKGVYSSHFNTERLLGSIQLKHHESEKKEFTERADRLKAKGILIGSLPLRKKHQSSQEIILPFENERLHRSKSNDIFHHFSDSKVSPVTLSLRKQRSHQPQEPSNPTQQTGIQTSVSFGNECFAELSSGILGEVQELKVKAESLEKKLEEKQRRIISVQGQIKQKEVVCERLSTDLLKFSERNEKLEEHLEEKNKISAQLEYIIGELNKIIENLKNQNSSLQDRVSKLQKSLNETTEKLEVTQQELNSKISVTSDNSLSLDSRIIQFENTFSAVKGFEESSLLSQSKIQYKAENSGEQVSKIQSEESTTSTGMFDFMAACFNKSPEKKCVEVEAGLSSCSHNSDLGANNGSECDQEYRNSKVEKMRLLEKLKYSEIQNDMLRRKCEEQQKQANEIKELKDKVVKLTEQNKVIKILRQKDKEKEKKAKESPAKAKEKGENNKAEREKKEAEEKQKVRKEKEQAEAQEKSRQAELEKEKEEAKLILQKGLSIGRKTGIEKRFIRSPSSPRSSTCKSNEKDHQDEEVCFELSPEK